MRHNNFDDLEQIYAHDISALKKLRIQENNLEKLNQGKPHNHDQNEEDNFAG